MKTAALLSLIFYSTSLLACNLTRQSDWFLPIASIYSKTTQVFVGKVVNKQDICTTDGPIRDPGKAKEQFEEKQRTGCYSYSFIVQKMIKGTFKKGDTVQIRGRLNGREKEAISYGRDCRIDLGFNSSESYLIFMDAFHPDAYRRVESVDSAWVKDTAALNLQ